MKLLMFQPSLQGRPLMHRTVPYVPYLISSVTSSISANTPKIAVIFRYGVTGGGEVTPHIKTIYERSTGTGTTPFWQILPETINVHNLDDIYPGNVTSFKTRVYTKNSSGVSTYSNQRNVTTPMGSRPGKVVDLTAIWNGTSISVKFYDISANEANPGFDIQRADDGGDFVQIGTAARRTGVGYITPYVDTTVLPGHTYQYRVRTINGVYVSHWNESELVYTADPLVSPAILLSVSTAIRNKFETDTTLPATSKFGVYATAFADSLLYMGTGNNPGNENGAEILSTPDGINYSLSKVLNEQGVHDIHIQGSDVWVAGTDPTDDWTYGNIYRMSGGPWTKLRTLPNVIHTLGLYHDGTNLWAATGAHTGDNATWKGRVLKSTDSGQTWTSSDVNDYRIYDIIGYNSLLYAVGYNWQTGVGYTKNLHVSSNGTDWTTVNGVSPEIKPRLTVWNDLLVGVQAGRSGLFTVNTSGTVSLVNTDFDIADQWNVLAVNTTDLYILATDGMIWRTEDLETWIPYSYVPNAISISWWTGQGLIISDLGETCRIWKV